MMRSLSRIQRIPAPLPEVWAFFSDPRNLDAITPPSLRLRIVGAPEPALYEGQLIEYRIRILPGWWPLWLTEIRRVRERESFVDEQRVGPYTFWHHEHRFFEEAGGVRMEDKVTYCVGWGPVGWLVERLWVGRRLGAIFDYRERAVRERFGGPREG